MSAVRLIRLAKPPSTTFVAEASNEIFGFVAIRLFAVLNAKLVGLAPGARQRCYRKREHSV